MPARACPRFPLIGKWSMRKIFVLTFLVILLSALIVGWFIDASHGGSHKASVQGQAQAEMLGIATGIKMMIEDNGPPKDTSTSSVTRLLFGDNPDHTEYLYRNAFKVNSTGQICDPAGQPYVIEISNNNVTVKSLYYGISIDQPLKGDDVPTQR